MLRLFALISAGLILEACSQGGGALSPQYLPSAGAFSMLGRDSASYRVLHSFENADDGAYPQAGLLDVNGTLYGTTSIGGKGSEGTVFSITTKGNERTIYSFGGTANDGYDPLAGLIDVNGTLYGTTYSGGAHGDGAVFSITTDGVEKVLYSFAGGSDGADPAAAVLDVNGVLYGTTASGGKSDLGTVFSLTLSGKEKVLHTFGSGTDGSSPEAGLIDVDGTLYGTTSGGGKTDAGTVFTITTSGKEEVLHDFSDNGVDGVEPLAPLVDVKNTLYGTTYLGGANRAGIVFSITTSGKEKTLHTFGHGSDGYFSVAPLFAVSDTLYGTASEGGKYGAAGGIVFSLTLSGKEKILHNFGKSGDGYDPYAGVIAVGSALYGTTLSGGKLELGIVFALGY